MTIKILGIETSCDETAAGVVEDGRTMLSNVISSQADLHSPHGGVVPEVASRQHVRDLVPILEQAADDSGLGLEDMDAIAVTYGPGLAGSLITGVNAAKAIAYSLGIPLIGVNHLEGHIYASWLSQADLKNYPENDPGFPLACLVASGGHTDLLLMEGHGRYKLVGRTRDDAAGEAFDKAARILGLGFPGGPEIQRVSEGATGEEVLPRAWMKDTLDFSFSGIKTALLHLAQDRGIYPSPEAGVDEKRLVRELAAAFQESVVDVVSAKLVEMAAKYKVKGLVLGGGVTANSRLREEIIKRSPLPVIIPPPVLCTDNGAMIAACGYFQFQRGQETGMDIDIEPGLPLG